ncbi:MAG: ectonucleotide pyrophosphatase/phosphodiesterase [Acidobacteriota bacterium]
MPRLQRCLCALALFVATVPAHAERLADHVVLISIDGLRPEFYLDPEWPAPMLRHMVEDGSHAEAVRGVYPSVTYPSHTTMVTGARPGSHGIFYNAPFEPVGKTGRWYWEAEAIRVPTLWHAVKKADGTSVAIGWPVTVGAEIDYLVPEIWSLDPEVAFIDHVRAHCHPSELLAELEREATGRLREETFSINYITRDDRAGDMAAYLLETYRPTLMLVHLIETDHFQHEDGRASRRVERAVAAVDRAVSQIYESAENAGILERTAFVVTGDHGHVDLHSQLAPNVWLAEAGLRGTERGADDWRATFHTTGASAFLHLADPEDTAAVTEVRKILDAQPRGVRDLFRIVERDELDRLDAAPEAALALDPAPGVDMTEAASGDALRGKTGATHGWIPNFPHIQTGLVAAGAGIRKGTVAAQLRLVDIAPLVAKLLDLELPASDGAVPLGFLATQVEKDH